MNYYNYKTIKYFFQNNFLYYYTKIIIAAQLFVLYNGMLTFVLFKSFDKLIRFSFNY